MSKNNITIIKSFEKKKHNTNISFYLYSFIIKMELKCIFFIISVWKYLTALFAFKASESFSN